MYIILLLFSAHLYHTLCMYFTVIIAFCTCNIPGGLDYETLQASVMFVSEMRCATFPFVPICDRVTNEGLENAILTISVQQADQGRITLGDPSITTVTINGKKQTKHL